MSCYRLHFLGLLDVTPVCNELSNCMDTWKRVSLPARIHYEILQTQRYFLKRILAITTELWCTTLAKNWD